MGVFVGLLPFCESHSLVFCLRMKSEGSFLRNDEPSPDSILNLRFISRLDEELTASGYSFYDIWQFICTSHLSLIDPIVNKNPNIQVSLLIICSLKSLLDEIGAQFIIIDISIFKLYLMTSFRT